MYISKVRISNYRSFGVKEQEVNFCSPKFALIGRNNSGKSNLISAIDILLGNRDPRYIHTEEIDYFDPNQPLKIEIELLARNGGEIYNLALPNKHQAAFYGKFKKDPLSAIVKVTFQDALQESNKPPDGKFILNIAGLTVHQKIPEARAGLSRITTVPAIRSTKDELKASTWTIYGNLMKSVLEDSVKYAELVTELEKINDLIIDVLDTEKTKILKYSKLITFIDDLKFQITKENKPSELLRNLEIFVKDSGKFFHIDDTGTGTQSAVIIGVLELALSYKASQSKIFIIEEPELYLHPQGIRYLSSLFDDFIQDGPSQIITTTHSATLISTFNPKQLIRFDKSSGESKVFQLPVNFIDVGEKVTRSLNSENAEMFFADKVLLVEGETEKIIFPELSKRLTLNNDSSAYFLKNNLSTVNVGGKDNIISYIKILDAFHIQWRAIVDDDYLDRKSTYSPTCAYFGIDKTAGKEALRAELLKFGIAILKEGETKDLVSNVDLATMVGKSSLEIETIKNRHAKTSEAFEKEIFNLSKPVYAFILVDFYMPQNSSPFDDLIKWAIG